jgi:hypothetical protein
MASNMVDRTEQNFQAAEKVRIPLSSEYYSESSLDEDSLSEKIARPIPQAKPAGCVPANPQFLPSAELIKMGNAAQISEEKMRSKMGRFE